MLDKKDTDGAELAASVGVATFYFATVSSFNAAARSLVEDLERRLQDAGMAMEVRILEADDLLDD